MVTNEQHKMFDTLFAYYNTKLFNNALNDCMIITSKQKNSESFFKPCNWLSKANGKKALIHEINLNSDILAQKDIIWHSILVHNMVHLWQHDFGKPSRSGYHNWEFANTLEAVGLMPSTNGTPNGMKIGQKMSQYCIPDGLFITAFNHLAEKDIKYSPTEFDESNSKKRNESKVKYGCPCGNSVWGKPGLSITCDECNQKFIDENQKLAKLKEEIYVK